MEVSVLQWNVWYQQDITEIAEEIHRFGLPDVICLQELTEGYIGQKHQTTWEFLGRALGMRYAVQQIEVRTPGTDFTQANAIFSKYPIIGHQEVKLHESTDPEKDQDRGYLEVNLDINGHPLTVGTTQMDWQERDFDHELEKLVQIIEARPKNYIFTGDINFGATHNRIQQIAKRMKHAGPPYNQNTWSTKWYDYVKALLHERYDYVYTSYDVETISSEIVQTDKSDHLPILAKFLLSL